MFKCKLHREGPMSMILALLIRLLSPLIFILSLLSIGIAAFIFWDMLIPECMQDLWSWIQVHRFFLVVIVTNIIFHMIMCISLRPGSPPLNSR